MPVSLKDHTEKLQVFVAVVKSGSFHAAANRLNLTQPTLSVAVQILEEVLETPLLVRSRQGVRPTQAGEKLLSFSERLLSEVDGVEQRIRHPEDPMSGNLRIGTFESLVIHFWPRFLAQMRKRYPHLRITLSTHKTGHLLEGLESRRLHLAVGYERSTKKGLVSQELYRDEFGFYASHRTPKHRGPETDSLIYVPAATDKAGQSLHEILTHAGVSLATSFEVDTFEAVRSLTLEGLGTGVLPRRSVRKDLQAGRLRKVQTSALGGYFGAHTLYSYLRIEDQGDPLLATVTKDLHDWSRRAPL